MKTWRIRVIEDGRPRVTARENIEISKGDEQIIERRLALPAGSTVGSARLAVKRTKRSQIVVWEKLATIVASGSDVIAEFAMTHEDYETLPKSGFLFGDVTLATGETTTPAEGRLRVRPSGYVPASAPASIDALAPQVVTENLTIPTPAVVVRDGDGNVIASPTLTYQILDTSIATRDPVTGLITGHLAGSTALRVTAGGVYRDIVITVASAIDALISDFLAAPPATVDEALPAAYADLASPTLLAVFRGGRGHTSGAGRKSFIAPVYNASSDPDLGIYPRDGGDGLEFDPLTSLLATNGQNAYVGGPLGYSAGLNFKDGISVLILATAPTTPMDEFFLKAQSLAASTVSFRHTDGDGSSLYPAIYQFYVGGPNNKIGYKYPRDGTTLMSRGVQLLPARGAFSSLFQIIGGRHYSSGISQLGGATPDSPGIFDLGAETGVVSPIPNLKIHTIIMWKGLLTAQLRARIASYCEAAGEPVQTRPIVNFTTNSIGELCQTDTDMIAAFDAAGLDVNLWGRSGAHWGSLAPFDDNPDISLWGRYAFTRARIAGYSTRPIIDELFEFVNSRTDDPATWAANEAQNIAALDALAARCEAVGGYPMASSPYPFKATNDMTVWCHALDDQVVGTLVPGNLARYGGVDCVMRWGGYAAGQVAYGLNFDDPATLYDKLHPTAAFAIAKLVPEAVRAAAARAATVPAGGGTAIDMTFAPVNLLLDVPAGGVANDMTFAPVNLTLDVP